MKKQRLRSRKQRFPAVGTRCADHVTPLYPPQVGTNFADRRRPLCQYSSLADYGHGVRSHPVDAYFFFIVVSSFSNMFNNAIPTHDMTYLVAFLLLIVC